MVLHLPRQLPRVVAVVVEAAAEVVRRLLRAAAVAVVVRLQVAPLRHPAVEAAVARELLRLAVQHLLLVEVVAAVVERNRLAADRLQVDEAAAHLLLKAARLPVEAVVAVEPRRRASARLAMGFSW
jgi:hypothetical protein